MDHAHTANISTDQTELHKCVRLELQRYFDLLDGESPNNLHALVIEQVEAALVEFVMDECRGNQSRAAKYLGISRGTLRTKLNNYRHLNNSLNVEWAT